MVSKGAISQLQEFVQSAKLHPMPPNCPVLQWSHDTRMVSMCLEFRATVAFLLDGVPHHVVGSWKHSKKLAQRDTAERTLALFVNRWGDLAAQDMQSERDTDQPVGPSSSEMGTGLKGLILNSMSEVEILREYCCQFLSESVLPPRWSYMTLNGALHQSFVEVTMFEVPHTFPGIPCDTQEASCIDAARRALWYLQCPGFENLFEPDPDFVKVAAQTIPQAPSNWVRDEAGEDEEQQLAERKTTVMRVQNRLQQAYARQLEAGTSVWYWSYDRHPRDKGWPPLFRATVHVPLAGKTFTGTWMRGQREAQIDACTQISEYLDAMAPRARGS